MQSHAQLAHHLLDAIFRLLKRPDYLWLIVAAVGGMIAPWFRKWQRQAKARTVRDWLAVSATIDVVSVVERLQDKKHYYAAVLTYFYHRPDLQMGEYEREFPTKPVAKQWANQFKGRSVMVHVNPNNPADSFLLESDLEGLETHLMSSAEVPAAIETPPPAFPLSYRFFSALGEVLSFAGLATGIVLLALSYISGGKMHQPWFLWTGTTNFFLTILFMYAVQFHVHFTEAHSFLSNYKQWTPAWMQWSSRVTVASCFLLFFLHLLSADLPLTMQLWMEGLAPLLPYLFASWSFLFSASFHTAILRSQEQVQPSVNVAQEWTER
jgi:hypothetical protein